MSSVHSIPSPASSINTSLLPTDSDIDEEVAPVVQWRPPVRPPPPYKEPNRRKLVISGIWALAGFFLCVLMLPTIFLRRPHVGQLPTSRKAASMAAFSIDINSGLGKQLGISKNSSPSDLDAPHDILLVWSGMGHRRELQNDTFAFDLQTRLWTRVSFGKRGKKQMHPDPRWKAATSASNQPPGLLVALGEVESRPGKRKLDEDMWMLGLPEMKWQSANVTHCSESRPEARRSHSAISFDGVDGLQSIVVFGGVLANETDVNETWIARLRWPNVTWELLEPYYSNLASSKGGNLINSGNGRNINTTNISNNFGSIPIEDIPPVLLPGPSARHGHSAALGNVYIEDEFDTEKKQGDTLHMIIFGGRDASQFLNDIWALSLDTEENSNSFRWKVIEVDDASPLPPPRANHAAAVYNERLYIWGGISGPTFLSAKPQDDLWVFNFKTKIWSKATMYGAQPLPRFLFSSALYTPVGASLPKLYIFGGETLERCKLNDVWALDLGNLRWDLLAPNFYWKRRCDRLFGDGYKIRNGAEDEEESLQRRRRHFF